MIEIGPLPTGGSLSPRAINNRNQIVGSIFDPAVGRSRAFIWDRARGLRELGLLPGHDNAFAEGINDAGQVVGASGDWETGAHRSFIWDPVNGMRELDASLGGGSHGANGINRFGEVVGTSQTASGFEHAFFRDRRGDVFDLGVVSSINPITYGIAVNDRGTVAGSDAGPTVSVAFIWNKRRGLRPLSDADTAVLPSAINNKSVIVGSLLSTHTRGFRWTAREGFEDLGSLGGLETDFTDAYDVNNQGVIVGATTKADLSSTAFIWEQRSGMRDLAERVDPTSSLASHVHIGVAVAINDRGGIIAGGRDLRDPVSGRSYLLAPRRRSDPACQ